MSGRLPVGARAHRLPYDVLSGGHAPNLKGFSLSMRVLDFDNTIYDGESPLDFYFFSLRYRPGNIRFIVPVIINLIRYQRSKSSRPQLERTIRRYVHAYLSSFDDIHGMVRDFWDTHMHKIKSWYVPQPDDVILTASFNYTMDEIVKRLGISTCICSTIDYDTLDLIHLNFGDNKVASFKQAYGDDAVPDEFYTDNLVDKPMLEYARSSFIVKGNKVVPYRK